MLDFEQMRVLVGRCTYKPGWKINLVGALRPYVQVEATTLDSHTLEPAQWTGAKHYLSPHMCSQEVIGVCFQAVKQAEEHELREFFRYRGAQIYNPHIDPEALVEVAERIVARPNPTRIE